MPVYSGVLKYFPDAIREVSKVSYSGNRHRWNKTFSKTLLAFSQQPTERIRKRG